MAKIKGKLIKTNRIGPLAYSKRTLKKSGGDDYTHNVKCVRLKPKKLKKKIKLALEEKGLTEDLTTIADVEEKMSKIVKNINDSISPIQRFAEIIQKQMKSFNDIHKRFEFQVLPLLGAQKEIRRIIEKMQNLPPLLSLSEIEKIARRYSEFLKELREEIKFNESTQWWRVDFILDDLPSQLIKDAKAKEVEAKTFTKLIIIEVKKENFAKLKRIKKLWLSYNFINSNRKEILNDVINACIKDKHTLVVPSILPQIEHFAKTYAFKYKNRYFGPIKIDEKGNTISLQDYIDWTPLYIFYKNHLFRDGRGNKTESNRSLISHGVDDNYAKEELSFRLILFLDKLLRLIYGQENKKDKE